MWTPGTPTLGIGLGVFLKDNFTPQAMKIRSAMEGMASSVAKLESTAPSLRNLGLGLTGVGVGIGYMFTRAIKDVIVFKEELYKTKAVVRGFTEKDLKGLEEAAIDMQYSFPYTALEISQSFRDIAKAGFENLTDIKKVAQASMAFAAGSDIQIGGEFGSTNMLINIASAFRMKTNDLMKLADKLNLTANLTPVDAPQIFESIQYAGPVIKNLGMNIDDALVMIGALAQAGEKSTRAGTSLANMWLYLNRALIETSSGRANLQKKALARLGLSKDDLLDSKGQIKDIITVFKVLQNEFKKLSPSERGGVFYELFGMRGQRAQPLLQFLAGEMENGQMGKSVEELQKAIKYNYQGESLRIIEERMNSPYQKYQLLRKSIFELKTAIYNAIEVDLVRILQGLTKVVKKFTEFFKTDAGKGILKTLAYTSAVLVVVGPIITALGAIRMILSAAKYAFGVGSVLGSIGWASTGAKVASAFMKMRLFLASMGTFGKILAGFAVLSGSLFRGAAGTGFGGQFLGYALGSKTLTTILATMSRVMPPWLSAVVLVTGALITLGGIIYTLRNGISATLDVISKALSTVVEVISLLYNMGSHIASPWMWAEDISNYRNNYGRIWGEKEESKMTYSKWDLLDYIRVHQGSNPSMSMREAVGKGKAATIIINIDGKEAMKRQIFLDQETNILRSSGISL